jgi:hypothetical protein
MRINTVSGMSHTRASGEEKSNTHNYKRRVTELQLENNCTKCMEIELPECQII